MLYLFIISFYIDLSLFCCTTRCSCNIVFVSFKSNTRGVTSIERTAFPSGAHEFTSSFQWSWCCSTFSFLCIFFSYHYLSFDLRFLITPLVFPNISYIVLGKGNINIIEGMFTMQLAMQCSSTQLDLVEFCMNICETLYKCITFSIIIRFDNSELITIWLSIIRMTSY